MIQRIVRAVIFALLALIGLAMAVIFTISTVLAMTVLVVVYTIRGKPFAMKEYWMTRQSRRKSAQDKGSLRSKDVTDVDSRDIR